MDVNLVLLKKNGATKVFPLSGSVATIGRKNNCDFCIPIASISRKHCQLNCDGGAITLRDLKSRNGTILNGKIIDEAVIQPGDCMEVGPLKFVFQIDGKPEKISAVEQSKSKPQAKTKPADSKTDTESANFIPPEELEVLLEEMDSSEDNN